MTFPTVGSLIDALGAWPRDADLRQCSCGWLERVEWKVRHIQPDDLHAGGVDDATCIVELDMED